MTRENERKSMTESKADRDQDQEQKQENRMQTEQPVNPGSRSGRGNDTDSGSNPESKSKVRGNVSRASGGEFVPKYNDDDILELLANTAPEPLSAPEVAEEVGCSRGTARNKLDSFVDDGIVATKKLGARSRGYWLTDTGVDSLGVAVY